MNNWRCPDCGGEWMESFRFNHDRRAPECVIGKAEDTVQAADIELLALRPRGFTRRSSLAERMLALVVQPGLTDDEESETVITMRAAGLHKRVVNGVDPDAIAAGTAAQS